MHQNNSTGWDEARCQETVQALLGSDDQHIPTFTGKNWREWDRRLQNLVRPLDGVLEILTGKVTKGKTGYDAKVDDALLALIDRNVDSSLYFIILGLDENEKGAAAYESLERHYNMIYAPSIKKALSEKVDGLHQEKDEAFVDYAVRALQIKE